MFIMLNMMIFLKTYYTQNNRVFLAFNAKESVILSGHNFLVPVGWLVKSVASSYRCVISFSFLKFSNGQQIWSAKTLFPCSSTQRYRRCSGQPDCSFIPRCAATASMWVEPALCLSTYRLKSRMRHTTTQSPPLVLQNNPATRTKPQYSRSLIIPG